MEFIFSWICLWIFIVLEFASKFPDIEDEVYKEEDSSAYGEGPELRHPLTSQVRKLQEGVSPEVVWDTLIKWLGLFTDSLGILNVSCCRQMRIWRMTKSSSSSDSLCIRPEPQKKLYLIQAFVTWYTQSSESYFNEWDKNSWILTVLETQKTNIFNNVWALTQSVWQNTSIHLLPQNIPKLGIKPKPFSIEIRG